MHTKWLPLFAAILMGLGLFVLIFAGIQYGIGGEITNKGVLGDYIGGVVGSLWALAGVVLFYAALKAQQDQIRLQRKEYQAQLEELKAQRKEFESNRIMTVLYRQLSLIQQALDRIEFNKHVGYGAILEYNRVLDLNNSNISDTTIANRISHVLKQKENILIVAIKTIQTIKIIDTLKPGKELAEDCKTILRENLGIDWLHFTNFIEEYSRAFSPDELNFANIEFPEDKKSAFKNLKDHLKYIEEALLN